jgi:hypothetical protein
MRGMDLDTPTPNATHFWIRGPIREPHLWRCGEWKTADATPTCAPAKGAGEA